MSLNPNWVPMRWPCGLLEAARQAAKKTLTPEVKETLSAWAEPQSLEMLKATPITCLVVPWADGKPEDQEHQQALVPLLRAGAAANVSFVGEVTRKTDLSSTVDAGLKAGLSALLVPTLDGLPKGAPAILRVQRSEAPWKSATSPITFSDNQWPGLGLETAKGDTAQGGPTGVPWVNSNGWFSLLARKLSGGKAIWLEYEAPDSSDLDHPATYSLAVADAAAYGGRWIISLDPRHRAGLAKKDPRALSTWAKITSTIEFFRKKQVWSGLQPQGYLAVVSDFTGDDEFMATEVLNLLARRYIQYKILTRHDVGTQPLASLKGIVWVDAAEPAAPTKTKLTGFVEQGGLLITPADWGLSRATPAPGGILNRFDVRPLGKGRVAYAKEGFKDPYDVAVDIHMIFSHRNDLVRIFNLTAANVLCGAGAQKKVVEILDYASKESEHPVAVWVRARNREARFWTLGAEQPVTLRGRAAAGGVEFQIPSFSTFGALEFLERGV